MTEARPVVVVGVDGSGASRDALLWAAQQAQLTGGEVHAVIAWEFPPSYGYYSDYTDAELEAQARKTLDEAVAESLGRPPSVPVTFSVIKGHPAEALLDAARSADLLVVGSRGRGAFARILLGSVSQHCVHHATCPVVVVRPRSGQPHRK